MAIFRTQEHTPDVYPRKSRDFQLLCNVFDCVNGGVKYDIDSIVDIVDTNQCNERLLPLLQTKLGFFTNENLTNEELRLVLIAFMKIVKDKGSRIGIREAIEVFLKVSNASKDSRIIVTNVDKSVNNSLANTRLSNTYIVEVSIQSDKVDTTLLTEILKYVLPAGYQLRYSFYDTYENVIQVGSADTVQIVFIKKTDNDGIRVRDSKLEAELENGVNPVMHSVHGVSTTATVPQGINCDDTYLDRETFETLYLGSDNNE